MHRPVFYPDEIRNALQAAEQASAGTADAGQVSPEYRQGYRDALATIALAFGLARQELEPLRWPRHALTAERR